MPFFLALILLVLTSSSALAADDAATSDAGFNVINTFWVLFAAFLVFFMQAGFGMVECGMIRAKNASNVLMKNLLDFCFRLARFLHVWLCHHVRNGRSN